MVPVAELQALLRTWELLITGIASAALAQLGVGQDCTALASNALAAQGIYFHG